MKYLLAATLMLMSAQAWSCSCFGISSIRETIATNPNLVEVQAVSVSANAYFAVMMCLLSVMAINGIAPSARNAVSRLDSVSNSTAIRLR